MRLLRATIETDAVVRVYLMAEFKDDAARYHSNELSCMQHDWDTNGVDICFGKDGAVLTRKAKDGGLLIYTEGVDVLKDFNKPPRSLGDEGAIGTVYKLSKVIDEYCRR